MRVAMLASEALPFVKTGGLADVLGALPSAIADLGHEVSLLLPLYRGLRDRFEPVPGVAPIAVRMHDGREEARVLRAKDPPRGVAVFAVAGGSYFDRPHLYGEATGDYADNARRFTFFCRAALAAIDRLGLDPDVVHCHDWQTALVPAYLRAGILTGDAAAAAAERLAGAAVIFTVHNLGYQGLFPPSDFPVTGLPRGLFSMDGVEFHGRLNLLKAGLLYADHIVTVSPHYAREIQTPEQGGGLDGVLRRRAVDLSGILNGIDREIWNPRTDPHIVARYSADDLHGKRRCKADLLVDLELDGGLDEPVIAMISRVAAQKGFDILLPALPELLDRGARVAILGQGDPRLEASLHEIASASGGRLAFRASFDDVLAHKLQAGADMLLVPSRYEPCGLTQMMALRYGTVPVVRATGGLLDTVIDMVAAPQQATGFWIGEHAPGALVGAVDRALGVYAAPEAWRALIRRGMAEEFSWAHAAARYEHLYRRVLRRRRGEVDAQPSRPVFGPTGWQAEIADGFTTRAAVAIAQAVAEHLLNDAEQLALAHRGVLVAHDTRFLGASFAERAAGVFAANDVPVLWSDTPLPRPAVSHAILEQGLAGAFAVGAGSAPGDRNGVSFLTSAGREPEVDAARDIEARAGAWLARGRLPEFLSPVEARGIGRWRAEDVAASYRTALAGAVDVDAIRASGLSVAIDLRWGTARGFVDRLLGDCGVFGTILHAEADPSFGGERPDVGDPDLLALSRAVRTGHALGIAIDGDGSRAGVIDADGSFVTPDEVAALLLEHLCETRPHRVRRVGRSVATSELVDVVARSHGVDVLETPCGFAVLGDLVSRGEVLLAADARSGLSILGHVPVPDGILAALMVVELVARRRMPLRRMIARIAAGTGARALRRREIPLPPEAVTRLVARLSEPPDDFAGYTVRDVVTLDGAKVRCADGRWLLASPAPDGSGAALVAEAPTAGEAMALLDAATRLAAS